MAVVMEIKELVVPLRKYSEGILEVGHDDQEPANGGKIAICAAGVSTLFCARRQIESGMWRARGTHGLMGSLMVSSRSSILLVCSLIASRGFDSDFSSLDPPKGLGAELMP